MWNRLRYSVWAPWYDRMVGAAGFEEARRRSIGHLALVSGARVLIVGAGTGLDLEYLPRGVHVTAVDVTPAMLDRLRRRAQSLDVRVEAHVMDARGLTFDTDTFDAVVLHLIVAVMPQPERGIAEAARVVKPGGRIAVFDKFLGDDERASVARRVGNVIVKILFSELNRRLGPLLAGKGLEIERDEPGPFGGMYRIVTLRKPGEPLKKSDPRC
jgi:phosphatidylethanolamine/phosphatidyl-N-methylethanolamine N-methyltransferase